MFDVDALPRTLSALFGPTDVRPVLLDEATDVIRLQINNIQNTGYPVVAYLGIVNLKTPGLEVHVGGTLSLKTYTSEFARQNDCSIAINGEAGASPQNDSGLGVWRGNFMVAGKLLQKEDPTDLRPFLGFNQKNDVHFTPMAAKDRAIAPDQYNVIWGRLDAVINDKVQTENERDRQPRTAMGIDKDGSHLYLLVIDGRQQRYSVGFTRAEVGVLLQAFGCFNGMLCDEGGSSCMWIPKLGGLINSPSDGEERPTYTHFGIAVH
jgi:exopolysaccharide biosynthesis protein